MPASRAGMARGGAWLGIGGALIAFVTLAVPHPDSLDESLLAALAGVTLLASVALIVGYDRLPLWSFHLASVLAIAIAAGASYAVGAEASYGALPFLWVVLYTAWFFGGRIAALYLVLVAAAYAGVLVAEDAGDDAVGEWLAVVATFALAAFGIVVVRTRMRALVASLTDAARRDPLTQLLNRRGFEEVFDVELERARRSDSPLSLVVADVDHFKALNDSLGHGAGDDALRRIAARLRAAKRSFDQAARVGGEEFALVVPDTDEHGAYILAERIRTQAEREVPPLTLSLGISTFPLHGQTTEALIKAGDQALYAAKRLGRNRSVISSAEVPGILARAADRHEYGQVEVASLVGLAEALDVRDTGNAAHCHRVGRFAELIARELGLPPDAVERLRLAGLLHDVGRVAIPDELIGKRGTLDEEEWAWIRAHPDTGARMLETTPFDDVRTWIRAHHERPDGRGYPDGLEGDAVPLEARILAVADAYEAMTSERPYRPALGGQEAADELRRGAGRQFDERVVEALLRVV